VLGFLCEAWGESDLPAAALVRDREGVRQFIHEEVYGAAEEDARMTSEIEGLMADFDEDVERCGEYSAEFEIGGISAKRVTYWIAAAPQPQETAQPVVQGEPAQKLWLWKNFVNGRPEYWAFDNPYPIHMDNGDPQTLGEPCGYAIFKPSRTGRTDVSEEQVLRSIANSRE
jgi:hypothetical protein